MKKSQSVINLSAVFLLVEALLAILLLAVLLTGLIGSFIYGQETTLLAGERTRAVMFAGEGLEAARSIRDKNFADLTDGKHGLAIAAGHWLFAGTQDSMGPFVRSLDISSVDKNRKTVSSTVVWSRGVKSQSVSFTSRFTNWQR